MNFDYHQLFGSPLEFFAVVTGVICVFLITVSKTWTVGRIKVDHVWNWPVGILTSAAYVYIFWHTKLYLNSLLQVFYVITGFLGWYWWLRGGSDKTRLPITRAGPKLMVIVVAVIAVAQVCMWQIEAHVAKSASPFWDAMVVTLSLGAQFVLTRKVLENWYLWIAVDIVGVVLFWSQGLQLTSVLYFIYGCICIRGLFTWHRMERAQKPVIPANPLERTHPEEIV